MTEEDLLELCEFTEDEPDDWSFWFKIVFFLWIFS